MSTTAPVSRPPSISSISLNTLPIDQHRGGNIMWCIIATEAMLFVSMFGAYYYLGDVTNRWANEMPPKLLYALILMAILLTSSVVLHWGEQQVKRGAMLQARLAIAGTVAIGLIFLAFQAYEYIDHWKTLTPYSDSYGSIFYAITTLHAAHVVVGLMLLCYAGILPVLADNRGTPHRAYHTVSMYWHFVDVVWVFIVLLLYLVPTIQAHGYGH